MCHPLYHRMWQLFQNATTITKRDLANVHLPNVTTSCCPNYQPGSTAHDGQIHCKLFNCTGLNLVAI